MITVTATDDAGAVNRYHTDPTTVLPATASGSPASTVAPTVVPAAGNVVIAAEAQCTGRRGAGQTTVRARLSQHYSSIPARAPAPSTPVVVLLGYNKTIRKLCQTVCTQTIGAPSNRSFPGSDTQMMHWPAELTASAVACSVNESPKQQWVHAMPKCSFRYMMLQDGARTAHQSS